MVILKNLKNRKIYDTLELYIGKLCELQRDVVSNPAAINDKDFYTMFLSELFGTEYNCLNDFLEQNKERFGVV